MSLDERIRSLGALSAKWLKKDFVFRRRAVSQLVDRSGFSEKMAQAMLDALFTQLTAPKLKRLLRSELHSPAVLDGFVRNAESGVLTRAKAPRTILHIFSANMPNAAVTSFVIGLLLGSRNLGKVSSRDGGMLGVYLESLKTHDRNLWKQAELLESRSAALRAIKDAGLVIAFGNDESLRAIRKNVPIKTPFVAYGHRVSFAVLLRETLNTKGVRRLAKLTAHDVWMADQRGCLSPVVVYVQKGGAVKPKDFAALLAKELGRLEKSERRGAHRTLVERIAMRRLEDKLKLSVLKGESAGIWKSPAGTWMVGYDEKLNAEFSGPGQTIRVKGFGKLSDLESALKKMSGFLQGASLECASSHRKQIAEWLGLFGVNRICRAGQLQRPPITWHHEGRLNFANWLNWVDLEK